MLPGSVAAAPPAIVPRQSSHGSLHSTTTSLAFSDWLVDDVASPATEGSASDDLVSTSATTPEHTLAGASKPVPFAPSSYQSVGGMAWQSGHGTGRFTVDAGGTASAPGSAYASASTSPAMPSHFDQIRSSAGGPMRSSSIAMPTAPSRHAHRSSDAHADDSLASLSTSVGRSHGRRSRQGSQSGGALSQSPSMTSLHSLSHKPYARPAPLTPVASTSFGWSGPPSASTSTAAPPSAGLSPILGSSKLPGTLLGDDISAIDFAALERDLPSAAAAPAPIGRPVFAPIAASAGATPPSRDELAESDSPEALASADPLATKLWRFYAKAKHALPHGQRMENLSWRMGGMKLGQLAAERELSASVAPSPASEGAERGRSSKAHVSFDDDAMDIDWRAKSRSRSRAPNRDAMDLDFGLYGALGGSGSEELDRFLSSLTASAEPPNAPSPAAEQPLAGMRAAYAADVAAHTPAPATGPDAELAAILGMAEFASPAPPPPPPAPQLRAAPSRAQTLEDHSLATAHPGGAMPRQSGSVPGLRNEEQLPSNQHHEYGFIPRLVRKTSFDGVTTPYFNATAGSGAPTPLSLSANATPGEMDIYAAVNATNWAMPTSGPDPRPALRHSYSPSSFLPPGTPAPAPFGQRPQQDSPPQPQLARVPSADQLQMLQHMYQQQQAAAAMSQVMPPVPLQYPYAAFLAQHHARTALRLAAASNAFAAANGLPSPMPQVVDPAQATFRPMAMPPTADGGSYVNPTTVSPWQLASGPTSAANSPSPTMPTAGSMSRQPSASATPQPQAGPSTAPPPKMTDADTVCTNCKTSNTPLWRRDELGRPLCNGCGLFRKLHGVDRPLSLATGIVKKRNRGSRTVPSTSASSSATSTPRKPNSRSSSRRTTLDHEELA